MQARTVVLSGIFAIGLVAACGGRSQIDFGADGTVTGGSGGSLLGGGTGGGVGASGGISTGGVGNVGGDGGIGNNGGTGATGGCGSLVTECGTCTCETCPDDWAACDADGGCFEILACAQQNGCSGIQCYFGPCMGVINQNGGPNGTSVGLAQTVGQCAQDGNCPCGSGGGGTGGGPGGGGGTGGGGPLACLSCINQQCPEVQDCILDQVCAGGVACALQTCLGSGSPDLGCMLGCFNGDFQAAFQAFQALQCFTTNCGQACGGLIPGLPGGGGPGNPGG